MVRIVDSENLPFIGAIVETEKGVPVASANSNGFVEPELQPGKYKAYSIGYKRVPFELKPFKNLTIELSSFDEKLLPEVEIIAEREGSGGGIIVIAFLILLAILAK